jgi:hypothetical protein
MPSKTIVTFQEKVLYHQVHPLKLATDISAAVVSTYFFWEHDLALGLVTGFVPPVVMSAALLWTQDFGWIRDSAVGRYLKRWMTHPVEAVRLGGMFLMIVGAWYRVPWMIALSVAVIVCAWLRGLVFLRKAHSDAVSPL